MGLTRETKE